MASIHREIEVAAALALAWDALRDVGRIHERLVRGFVTDCRLEGDTRVVTFGNGMTVQERIVDIDDAQHRVAWSAVGAPFVITTPRCRHSPKARIAPVWSGSRICCRTRWQRRSVPWSTRAWPR